MKKNNYPKAFRSFCRLRLDPLIAARDLYYSHVLYEIEKTQGGGKSYVSRLADIFRVPRIRRGTLAASTVMIAQQMCGINIISFYSSTVFVRSGYSEEQALFASLGFGALNFVCTIPAIFLIDTFGRRSLLLSTFPLMCVFLLATGLTFLMDEARTQLRTGLIALWIYLFTAFYSVGEGPVAFMYSAEVFPNIHREQGMAWAVCVNNFFAAILGLTFPSMERAMTTMGACELPAVRRRLLTTVCFYAGLNAVALVWIFFWVPETKGLTLEELDRASPPHAKLTTQRYSVYPPSSLTSTSSTRGCLGSSGATLCGTRARTSSH
jgi:MFS family permease